MEPGLRSLTTGPLDVNCYLVWCGSTGRAVVVDPGGDPSLILSAVRKERLEVTMLLATHGHFDHVGGVARLAAELGAPFSLHRDDLPVLHQGELHAAHWGMPYERPPSPETLLRGGEELPIGRLRARVLHTPGHSPGGICLHLPGHVLTGDSLFAGSIGRTDLPGGSFEVLVSSIRKKLLTLPDETLVHPGHGPGSSIAAERAENPFLA